MEPAIVTVILLLTLLLQEKETIPKAQKAAYLKAVKACDRAAESIEDAPRETIEAIDSILKNSKIRVREAKLRIQLSGGSYTRWYEFYPYQFRGRARLVLAEKAEEREVGLNLLRNAESDFNESIRRGLEESRTYLKNVRTERKRWEVPKPPVDPEPAFRRNWNDFVGAGKFIEARKFVQEKGGFLSKEKRQDYLSQTEDACLKMVSERLKIVLLNLEKVLRPENVTSMGSATFSDAFALPDKKRLITTSPVLDWCIAVRETFRTMRRGKDVLDPLIAHGVASVSLVEKGENGWFRSVEKLAFNIISDRLQKIAAQSGDADVEKRKSLRQEALALRKKWEEFERTAGRLSRGRNVTSWEADFPVELDGIGKIPDELFSCAEAVNPLKAVLEMEERLRKYREKSDRFTIESRRSVLRYQIVAGALRHFLEGKTVTETVRALRSFGGDLTSLGGSLEEKRFGPKVEKVFKGLR